MASAYPGCGISWNLLAGIGRIESMHANGGATDASVPRSGPSTGPSWTAHCRATKHRAEPQHQPGRLRPRDRTDAVPTGHLVALCLRRQRRRQGRRAERIRLDAGRGALPVQRRAAPARSVPGDDSDPAVQQLDGIRANVLGWAAAYATGVVPVDLPPITGPIPPIADVHLDNYQGLGPGLPSTSSGCPPTTRFPWCRWSTWAAPTWPARSRLARTGRCSVRRRARASRGAADDDAACSGAEPATVDAAAAATGELRGVLHRHQPARSRTAAAAARGASTGHRRSARRTGHRYRHSRWPTSRYRPASCRRDRNSLRHRAPRPRTGGRTSARPGCLTQHHARGRIGQADSAYTRR